MTTPVVFYEYTSPYQSEYGQWTQLSTHTVIAGCIYAVRLLTWNVWFDKPEQDTRYHSVLHEILSIPLVDIISIQEVTSVFLESLRVDATVRNDWLMTDYTDDSHQQEIPPNWYGNIFLIRKKWAGNIRGWVKKFPTSSKKRFIEIVEIFQERTSVIRIGNAHFDSPSKDVEERKRQANLSIQILAAELPGSADFTPSTLIILSGDLNFQSTAELENITARSFQDTITITNMSSAVENRESATLGITYPINTHAARRSDFILFKGNGWKCVHHAHHGNNPIKDFNGDAIICQRGRDGHLFPSDHLGIIAQFTKTS